MHHFKSANIAISHAAQCLAQEMQSYADAAMNYSLGKIGGGAWGPKEAGDFPPAWSALYCASQIACDLSIACDDGKLSQAQANEDYREILHAIRELFGANQMSGIAEFI
jgi:hypothetical protein